MSEIITAVLAVAIAAQVAVMAKAGKDFLNSSLNASMYGKTRGEHTQLESEAEVNYTYDDENYEYNEDGDSKNEEQLTTETDAAVDAAIDVKLSI